MEPKIIYHSEKELMGLKFTKDIETRLQIFKVHNKISLPMDLEQSVIIEMNLNEDNTNNNASTKNSNKSELCITIPIFCIMSLTILSGIGLVVYFYIKDIV